MGEFSNEDRQLIEKSKIRPDTNVMRFFKMEKVSIAGNTLSVDKMRGISINNCDFTDLKSKNIVDGGIEIEFNKKLPDLNEVDCRCWRYDKENKELFLQWGRFGNIQDTFTIVDDNLVFFLGDFGAIGDYKDALDSLMARIGEYFVRR